MRNQKMTKKRACGECRWYDSLVAQHRFCPRNNVNYGPEASACQTNFAPKEQPTSGDFGWAWERVQEGLAVRHESWGRGHRLLRFQGQLVRVTRIGVRMYALSLHQIQGKWELADD